MCDFSLSDVTYIDDRRPYLFIYYLLGKPNNVKCSEFDNNHFIDKQLNSYQTLIPTTENEKVLDCSRNILLLVAGGRLLSLIDQN